MTFRLHLPAELPQAGAEIRVRFRRVPERSCAVRATLLAGSDAPIDLGVSYIYGRGKGSEARAATGLHIHLDPRARGLREGRDYVLALDVEDLNGEPLGEPSELELVSWELVPSP